eukprot:jgi/Mesvir1/26140/Mv06851-RA.1
MQPPVSEGEVDTSRPAPSPSALARVSSWGSSLLGYVNSGINSLVGEVQIDDELEVHDPDDQGHTHIGKADELRQDILPVEQEERQRMLSSVHKYIGLDVTSLISLPIFLFEPLTTLQKMAEIMEYDELLNKAAACQDPIERMLYTAAWAVSPYAANERTWTPLYAMLGETYELCSPSGVNYIAEQVGVQPNLAVAHAENEHWSYTVTSSPRTKFLGNAVEVYPVGRTCILFKKAGVSISLVPPISKAYNILMGRTWIDSFGDMVLENLTTGEKSVLTFKPCGWFSTNRYEVEGKVMDADGVPKARVFGKSNDNLSYVRCRKDTTVAEGEPEVLLWRKKPLPQGHKYGFTEFAGTLSTVATSSRGPHGALVPPLASDSRRRADRLAIERGDLKKAAAIRSKLEERQRSELQERQARKLPWVPRFFRRMGPSDDSVPLDLFEVLPAHHKRITDSSDSPLPESISEGVAGEGFAPWQFTDEEVAGVLVKT